MKVGFVLDALITAGLYNEYNGQRKIQEALNRMTDEQWEELWENCTLHQIWSVVWAGFKKYPRTEIPEDVKKRFEEYEKKIAFQYYSMLSFTTLVLSIFRESGIPCYVLKGITLTALYPREDMRKFADADIYIPDIKEYRRAAAILEDRGFRTEHGLAEFHSGYTKKIGDKICLLELHWRPCDILLDAGMDRAAMQIYEDLEYAPDLYQVTGAEVPALPPTENALQLLLHMFHHLLQGGFGLRMLCDWCVFWNRKGGETNDERFSRYLDGTGLTGFAWAVTQICKNHLGLSLDKCRWMSRINGARYKGSAELLYQDILAGGEFGRGDKARVTMLRNRTFRPVDYAKEVHRVMRYRFPKLRKVIIAWPVLWAATIWIFLKNNRRLSRGKITDVIKSAEQRNYLLTKMKVYEKKEKRQ